MTEKVKDRRTPSSTHFLKISYSSRNRPQKEALWNNHKGTGWDFHCEQAGGQLFQHGAPAMSQYHIYVVQESVVPQISACKTAAAFWQKSFHASENSHSWLLWQTFGYRLMSHFSLNCLSENLRIFNSRINIFKKWGVFNITETETWWVWLFCRLKVGLVLWQWIPLNISQ